MRSLCFAKVQNRRTPRDPELGPSPAGLRKEIRYRSSINKGLKEGKGKKTGKLNFNQSTGIAKSSRTGRRYTFALVYLYLFIDESLIDTCGSLKGKWRTKMYVLRLRC